MDFVKLMQAQIAKMKNISQGALDANREMTTEENTAYDACKAEITRLKAAEARHKEIEADEKLLTAAAEKAEALAAAAALNPASVADSKVVKVGANLGEGAKAFESRGSFFQAVISAKLGVQSAIDTIKNAGLNTKTDGDGGVLCPPEYMSGLMGEAKEESELYKRCTVIPTSKNTVVMPGVDETSRADGSRWGGISVDWVDEGAEGDYTYPKFRGIDVKLGKLMGLTAITEELLSDAQALDSWISRAFPSEMAFVKDQAIFDGDGNGKPLGFQSHSNVLVSVTRTTSSTVKYEDVVNMFARMTTQRRKKAIWVITPEVQTKLPLMNLSVGTGGSAVYLPAGGASAAPFETLFGRPVISIEQAAELGAVGDISLVDLSDYMFFEKGGVKQDSSIHVFFNSDKRAFRFIQRCNGTPYTRKAVASRAKAAFTLSPYITLAA